MIPCTLIAAHDYLQIETIACKGLDVEPLRRAACIITIADAYVEGVSVRAKKIAPTDKYAQAIGTKVRSARPVDWYFSPPRNRITTNPLQTITSAS